MSLSRLGTKYFKLAVGIDAIGKETDVDISARCPICGDSQKKKNSKRLHFYTKGSDLELVHCFNGDCELHGNHKSIYKFLKEHYPTLFDSYKRENMMTTVEKLASGNLEDAFSGIDNKVEEKKEILTQDLSMFLTKIEDKPEALEYIKSRGLEYNKEAFGQWYYGHQDLKIGDILYKITNAIVLPLYYKNEMYGFYSRNISDKTFYTYNNPANIGYKIFNWFNIDKESPVYIYEGIFDMIAGGFKNSIALMGAKLPEERLKELKHPIFVLDNDKTGLLNSLNYCKRGYSVYIQPNNLKEKDMNDLMKQHNFNFQKMRELIQNNIYSGIMAEVRIKEKL